MLEPKCSCTVVKRPVNGDRAAIVTGSDSIGRSTVDGAAPRFQTRFTT